MSNSNEASTKTKLKTGIFTVAGLLFLGSLTVYVNNRPFWWRTCEPVQITVEDATGLKIKAPVKSLGLEIGYISDLGLVPAGVVLRVCITGPVEVQPETKAYVRSEGFLGDKFLELKPVKYTGSKKIDNAEPMTKEGGHSAILKTLRNVFGVPSAEAADSGAGTNVGPTKQIPLGEGSTDMNALMTEMKNLTTSLRESINPEEIRGTIRQLNKTLEDASRALSPQGGLTQTAQRSLIKLEDAIEQLRDQMTRVNQGQGSVGMILNDPIYAEELKKAMLGINKLLGRAAEMRLEINLGIQQLTAYNAARASIMLGIWTKPYRYYLLGVDMDPRGRYSQTITETSVAGTNNTVQTTVQDKGGFNLTFMFGRVLKERFDVSIGLLRGDGAASLGLNLGGSENVQEFQLKSDLYFRPKTINGIWTAQPDGRIYLLYQPKSIFYLMGGVEGFRKIDGKFSAMFGGGMRFDDEDIKLLLSFL